MKIKILNGLLLASTLVLSSLSPIGSTVSLAHDPAATPAPKPVMPEKMEIRDVDPALWVVKDEDTTIYLFGTVHVLRPGLSWFDEAVKDAFDESDKLILEIVDPPASEAQMAFGKYAPDSTGTPLREKLAGADRDNYDAAMKKLGIPAAAFDPLDPWAAAVTIQILAITKAGYDPNQGAEKQLTAAAKAAGKPIGAVETMEGQLAIFDGLPQGDQLLFLNASTQDLGAITDGIDLMVDAWGAGDAEGLGKIINAGFTSPELKAALLTRRNAQWAIWIDKRMKKPGTIFMAVGAGHLTGDVSLQKMLKPYGITATRIKY
ncbi:MAG: TraB/GumN family protein [Sphingorhabdus sp.]